MGEIADEPQAPEYTIDEVAAAAGLPSRTVRHYQSEGLLPPPAKRGRVAIYGPHHLDRLELVAQLRDRGLSLRSIRDALAHVERGELSLEEWLGIGDELRRPWIEETPEVLTAEQAEKLFADRRAGLRSALTDVGLLRAGDGLSSAYVLPSPRLLEIALALDDVGVDVETAAGAAAIITKRLRKTADELVDYYIRHAGDGFGRSAAGAASALEPLRPLAVEAVSVLFAREIGRAVGERIDDVGESLSKRATRGSKDREEA